MNIFRFLSNVSIKHQVIFAFVPTLLILFILIVKSQSNFSTFFDNFTELNDSHSERVLFLEIERDVLELQRNILVYSYIGYNGVLRKIEFSQEKLDAKFDLVKSAVGDPEISKRLVRLEGHYHKYKDGFQKAVQKKTYLRDLFNTQLEPALESAEAQINQLVTLSKSDLSIENHASHLEVLLLKVAQNTKLFLLSLDAQNIQKVRSLLREIELESSSLRTYIQTPQASDILTLFDQQISDFEVDFKIFVDTNRVYLQLINVVLAGKSAEMNILLGELDVLIKGHSNNLKNSILANMQASEVSYTRFSVIAGIIGFFLALLIARSIVRPITQISATLSSLSKGESAEIPALDRHDEIGVMAHSAEEFKVMAESLKQKTAELEEFSYRTSHDLRSPLVSSIGLLNLVESSLQKQDLNRANQATSLAKESLKKLEVLIRDILELAKVKNIEEDDTPINVTELIDAAITKFEHMEGFSEIKIVRNLHFSGEIRTKASRLTLIIENLISNAIKYCDPEKDVSFITISTANDGEALLLSVEDNGLGIPKDQQDKLFTMFKRFHPKVSFGSGLGLYMMKKSVDILKGHIVFKDLGNGTLFTVRVPQSSIDQTPSE